MIPALAKHGWLESPQEHFFCRYRVPSSEAPAIEGEPGASVRAVLRRAGA